MGFFPFLESEEEKEIRLKAEAKRRSEIQKEVDRLKAEAKIEEEDQEREFEGTNRIVVSTGLINKEHNIMQVICAVAVIALQENGYTTQIEYLHALAVQNLKRNAYRVGADAVINTSFQLNQGGGGATIFCTGTAVQFI